MSFGPAVGVRRCILLIEMDDGMQHAYEVTHLREAVIERLFDDYEFSDYYLRPQPSTNARITVEGTFRGLMRQASYGFDDHAPEVEPDRPELPPAREAIDQ